MYDGCPSECKALRMEKIVVLFILIVTSSVVQGCMTWNETEMSQTVAKINQITESFMVFPKRIMYVHKEKNTCSGYEKTNCD
ncbi:hypothetical protein ACET3Z_000288 [Daucus carota]